MKSIHRLASAFRVVVVLGFVGGAGVAAQEPYRQTAPSSDGTGIVYMGRETAGIMGHEGADWLERPDREAEERPDLLIRALALRPGMQVADIGAGTGYYSWRMAEQVAPREPAAARADARARGTVRGRVYAVDVQPEMLTRLSAAMAARGVANVVPVLGTGVDPHLPSSTLDLALMVDVYHEFDHPREMLAAIVGAVRPGGRVVFVEYRQEDPKVNILPHHKMSEAQVRREATAAGLVWRRTIDTLPMQHVVVFERPATSPAP